MVSLSTSIEADRTPLQGEGIRNVCLIRPPYFTPWAPPLGIALLKSFLEKDEHLVTCFDFNVDSEVWACHLEYFTTLQAGDSGSAGEGFSKIWSIFNAHLLAYMRGASTQEMCRVVLGIAPFFALRCDERTYQHLSATVSRIFARLDELLRLIDFSRFHFVGTSTYTTSLGPSLFVLKKAKEVAPHVRTVMGGGVFADDLALESDNLNTLLNEFLFVDHVALGEGELLFKNIVEGQFDNRRLVSISDINRKSLDAQEVPLPDFSDFNLEPYFHLTVEGGRSCPFQCSFCSETIQWGTYRKKTNGLLTEHIQALTSKYRKRHFFMADSLMNPYIEAFSTELLSTDANVFYDGYLRADPIATSEERVERWANSGCFRVRLGIESGSPHVLELMHKKTNPKTISQVLKTLASAGIRTTTYWIVGHPGETIEDFQETIEFIRENRENIYELEAHPFYYYPYGQVASRLYTASSLYPDEVTDVIRFRQWEINGCNPPRDERFRRLRLISHFALAMGIPNIYSMTERYKAEDRWHRLHPKAIDVY
jgi:hypothetical protein